MKAYFLIVSVSILLLFYSCGEQRKEKFIIAVSQCSDDAWRRTMNEEILREATFYDNVEIKILTAYDSNQKQIRDIESFINQKVDLLVVSPNSAIPLKSIVEKAMDSNIPVILVDRKINSSKYTSFVGADNFQIGKEVARYVGNLLGGTGNVVEIRGLEGSTPDLERHSGFVSGISSSPAIKLVSQINGNWSRTVSKQKMIELLKAEPEIDLIFAQNDEMAAGAFEALKDMGLSNKRPYIIGIDALPGNDGGIQNVIDGNLDATFIYPTGGEKVVQTALKILEGGDYEKVNMLYTAVVDNSNARIIKLQTEQIQYHQTRINSLNTVLNKNLALYATQKTVLTLSITLIFIFLILVILLLRSYRNKNKINHQLESTNQAIIKQKEEISEQRDQLITLSKNLEEATQSKLTFFTNISHEFRTPLSLILGPLQTITKTEELSSEGKRLLQMMNKNVLVLLKLIDQIIEFRRYENGKMKMYYTFGNLKAFLSEQCDSFQEIAKKKKIRFNFDSSVNDFMLWFDTDKVEKIFNNLISNALKFTPEEGKITVFLSKTRIEGEDFAKISVKDSGIGISDEHIKKIFERFYRADDQLSSSSGIGLALTKVLVEQHSGRIDVVSSPEKGSVFEVIIPFKQKNITIKDQYPVLDSKSFSQDDYYHRMENELTEEKEEEFIANQDVPSLLLVEDNLDVRSYIKMLFKDKYKIHEATNGQNGYLMAVKLMPDVILSDVMMDGMNGYELCKSIKENISTSHIPVILLTALSMDEQRAKGFESGADAYIPKPFNEEILLIRVRKILENREKMKGHFQETLGFGDKKLKLTDLDTKFIDRLKSIVEDNLLESEINMDELAKNMGLSHVQLYRKVKSLTNYSPNELVRIFRLKVAEKLLLQTDKTISEIAYDTGFSSPSYFTKSFREHYKESPSDFLKRVRNEI